MVSRSRRANLVLPVTRVTLRARKLSLNKRFTSTSGVAIAAALECFANELLIATAEAAERDGRKRLHVEDVIMALDQSACGCVVRAPVINSVQHLRGVAKSVQVSDLALDDIRNKFQNKARERLEVAAAKAEAKAKSTTKTKSATKAVKKRLVEEEEEEDEATTNGSAQVDEDDEEDQDDKADQDDFD